MTGSVNIFHGQLVKMCLRDSVEKYTKEHVYDTLNVPLKILSHWLSRNLYKGMSIKPRVSSWRGIDGVS